MDDYDEPCRAWTARAQEYPRPPSLTSLLFVPFYQLIAIMKFHAVVLVLASAAAAAPVADATTSIAERQSPSAVTDLLLFGLTLPQFTARRNNRDPATLDWSTDGCTNSPDNPFGFPFLPGCHRHDFGYRNYRAQSRFNKDAKAKIDLNFKNDLYYQCEGAWAKRACRALADVYYQAVRRFGGSDTSRREEAGRAYEEAVVIYEKAVKEAQEEGLLPVLN
ncbi:phospholipase A2 [Purpureocillium lavendulum]|uniref:Phospholipase A2 n=1 Tax=Purpureocillium lavendulum TaxID=1247861 RepID=A0AB34FHM8_9HYPO|nr:phospholipase A2 [Purpureocillium lavendulum]